MAEAAPAFPGCVWCRHFSQVGPASCRAFPDGIPPAITIGTEDHLEQRTDLGQDPDNTVVFERIARFDELYPHTLPSITDREPTTD